VLPVDPGVARLARPRGRLTAVDAPLCHDGTGLAPPKRRRLRAGPLGLDYEAGDLRYLTLGDREVVRRWYVAVRDRDWGTVPAILTDEHIESGSDSFRVRYRAGHRRDGLDFAWTATIEGTADGAISFAMEGEARSTFLRNRIGFCLLHPMSGCAGAPCRFDRADGGRGESAFPAAIAPDNPFTDLKSFAHEVAPGVWAELEFAGDLFEMEDQRNWIDASFKTFCTPLRLPFPVEVAAGTRVAQRVTLRIVGGPTTAVAMPRAPSLTIGDWPVATRPAIGLAQADRADRTTDREAALLRAMRPAHLRIEIDPSSPDLADRLDRAIAEAATIGAAIEAAVTVDDPAGDGLATLAKLARDRRPPIARWLIFARSPWSTPAALIDAAREHLGRLEPPAPIYAGTTANFAELNRGRPPTDRLDGLCYAAQPQEHAFDNASIVEAAAAMADTVESAREFADGRPIAVTPITLRKRVNPYATGPATTVPPGEPPPTVDPRQLSLLGGGWTLAALKHLAESGAGSATFYETVGPLGVVESEAGSPWPDRFPSRPGMAYPLYHVLADACEWAAAEVLQVAASSPLVVDGLALRNGGALRVMVANLAAEPIGVPILGLIGERALVCVLDESTYDAATADPAAFRSATVELRPIVGGRLDLELRPFAYVKIDVIRGRER